MNRSELPIYRKGQDNLNWNIPSLLNNDKVALLLLDILESQNIKSTITSAYGSPKCSWNGWCK